MPPPAEVSRANVVDVNSALIKQAFRQPDCKPHRPAVAVARRQAEQYTASAVAHLVHSNYRIYCVACPA
jgi:hypothetical protein